jgi:hypothetical protein
MFKQKSFFVVLLFTLFFCLTLASCGGGGGTGYAFQDNFDSYTLANPWTPAGGWTTSDTDHWAIVAGLSGNGVQNIGTGSAFLASSYTGTDYTVSVRVRPETIVDSWEFGIFARDDSNGNRYSVVLNDDTTSHITTIGISKFYNDGGSNGKPNGAPTFINSDLNTSTYYTLTLTVSTVAGGTQVTATVTDGTNTKTDTWFDDGLGSYGAIIPSGKAGLLVYSGPAYPVIYDDFTVSEP